LNQKVCIIVNPAAGRGRAHRILREIESAAGDERAQSILTTRAAGDEERLTDEALERGAQTIVVVGGDGTFSKIAQRILVTGRECALALIPSGTGNDIAKTLAVYGATPEQVLRLVARGNIARIDAGRVDQHYFINTCGFGFDSSVLEATSNVRFLKGDALYIYSALAQLFSYRGVDVRFDGPSGARSQEILMAIAANGRSLGGAFRIAPQASVTDGKLDFSVFSDANVWGRIRLFAGALRGKHLTLPGVTHFQTGRISLTFRNAPTMEVDGELRKAASRTVTIECVPRALSVIAAPGAPL
jgi:diacylglycerol kinase (ATP)